VRPFAGAWCRAALVAACVAALAGCGSGGTRAVACDDANYEADSVLLVNLQVPLADLEGDTTLRAMKQDAGLIIDGGARARAALAADMPCASGLVRQRALRLEAVGHWIAAARVIRGTATPADVSARVPELSRQMRLADAAWTKSKGAS
jgi:hypothetical protein